MSDKAKTHTAGCQSDGGEIICIDPPMCFKPAQWVCNPNSVTVSCVCSLPPPIYSPPPGRLCTASIVYGVNTPANPALVPMQAHCDAAGLELALAVMLARLLGAP